MSELKATSSGEIRAKNALLGYWWYEQSEANKVIDEKDAKILALDAEVFKQKHHAKLFFDERNYAETQLRHYKYKHCLDMAYKCAVLCQKSKDLYRWTEDENLENHYNRKIEFFARWHNRWLKIAEKFKDVK